MRQPSAADGGAREKKEIIVNSQKSIYKPNLRRVDSSSTSQKPPRSTQLKRGDSSAKLRQSLQGAEQQSIQTPSIS